MSFFSKIFPCLQKKNYGHFTTNHGITIFLSKLSKDVSIEEIEKIENWLIDFWKSAEMGWNSNDIAKCLFGVKIKLIDKDLLYLELQGEKIPVYAYTLPDTKEIFMAIDPGERKNITTFQRLFEGLFKHEVSHVIVGSMNEQYWDQEKSHKLFESKNLGV